MKLQLKHLQPKHLSNDRELIEDLQDHRPPPSAAGLPPCPPRSGASTPGSGRPDLAIDYSFKGRWHCGKPNSSRAECKEYIDTVEASSPGRISHSLYREDTKGRTGRTLRQHTLVSIMCSSEKSHTNLRFQMPRVIPTARSHSSSPPTSGAFGRQP